MKTATLSVLLAVSTAFAANPASVEIKGSKPLQYGKLAAGATIHPNRNYVFNEVPKDVSGLHYLMHEHKGPANLDLEVKSGGELYLCLWETSPKTLRLPGQWQSAGKAKIVISGRKYDATIYRGEVQSGQKLKIPSKDRWGSVVIASKIGGVSPFDPKKAPSPAPKKSSKSAASGQGAEFRQLQADIVQSKSWNMPRVSTEALRKEALVLKTDRTPVDIVIRRTRALLENIKTLNGAPSLDAEAKKLDDLAAKNADGMTVPQQESLFYKIAAVRRKIAFSNPLLSFDRILFLKHHKSRFNHMCDQYYGFNARPGGGLYVLEKPFGDKPQVVNLLADSVVTKGRLKGQKLKGGSYISLDLDYDAKTILFAYTELSDSRGKWVKQQSFHIFKVNSDGSNLQQLTDGPWNDFDPCFLPSGRIVFVSERIGGFLRCGRHCPTYTIHGMMGDGSDIIHISYHETHEWHPSVDNEGMLIYTRWDYVDRDSDIAHHIWHSFPDGRDPRSYHGNYPELRECRPWMEMSIRAIPESNRYIATAAPHHGQAYGSFVIIDIRKKDDRSTSQLKRVTPEVRFPESENAPGVPGRSHKGGKRGAEVYGNAWPLSENYYLCVYDPGQRNYGIYLLDSFGNRELLYRDPSIACLDPIPFVSRTRPPAIPCQTSHAKADRKEGQGMSLGTVTVMNIYESEFPFPKETKIKYLRIVNIFPKATPPADKPRIGHAAQALARGVLGTVPVEADGSVHFRVPTGAPIYFQALDENGMVVQNMRSNTFVHPGETLGCIGCHEPKNEPPKNIGKEIPLALKRPASKITPDVSGSYPLTFPRLVQPVLDKKCLPCHEKQEKAPRLRGDQFGRDGWSEAMHTMRKYAWGKSGGNGAIRGNGRSYSIPGKEGARVSKLYSLLTKKPHSERAKLTVEEMHRITLWLDCNSNFYGAYFETEKQANGEIVRPKLGIPAWSDFDSLVK